MRYLVDSHILLWAAYGSPKLPKHNAEIIASPESIVYFSIVTLWELAIKRTIGKLAFQDDFFTQVRESGYHALPITEADLLAYIHLPLHHCDPFDRMLVAQAQSQGMTLLTVDKKIHRHYADIIPIL